MASFNSWNGKKVHGDYYLLTEVLKNQMEFDGFVVEIGMDMDKFLDVQMVVVQPL